MKPIMYEVWAMKDDLSLPQPELEDSLIASFTQLKDALWFADHFPFECAPNTKITVEETEFDEEGNGTCRNLLQETFLS